MELKASETLLQRGIRVRVRAPLWLRMFFVKTVVLKLSVPYGGALLRMGSWYLKCQLSIADLEKISLEDSLLFNVRYGENVYKALACLFIGNKLLTRIFLKPYASWLRENMTQKQCLQMLSLVIASGGLEDLMTTTRYIRGVMITAPRLGQVTKRS